MSLGIVLAAGASRRFGSANKLLAPVAGQAMVLHAIEALRRAGLTRIAAVVSSPEVSAILPADVRQVVIAPEQGLSASFHAAIDLALAEQGTMAGGDKTLLVLGDMPLITPKTLQALLARSGSAAASHGGVAMPPIALAREDLATARASAAGDRGARGFLAGLPPSALVALDAREARDIDYAADLEGI